ncbi:hypothetical protein BOX17_00230 [Halomonas aestuarii]|uniref:Uncharacterized protein n=1 Tax=Halomonas aestuarii TaxID=1897729 RepID=A0A1J0VC10_9GAMM|nr:hypothetical protein [Halomonas aestuarii]APE29522.1 hypothetical protein BOX17_00230 [Halomonas aestuarii]
MKHQNSRQPVDEREKLRQFRELDDAFAEALRELESSDSEPATPDGAPMTSHERQAPEAAPGPQEETSRQQLFEERLKALMSEYAQPADHVSRLLQTLKSLGRIA